jgi:hypothetical protein
MLYEKQNGIEESDNNALPEEDTYQFPAKTEIPQENTAEGTDERTIVSKVADEPDGMSNEITDNDSDSMRDGTEIDIAPVNSYPTPEDLPVETAIDNNEDNYNADEVVLDPDNFEYFKGVSSNNSETNFVYRYCFPYIFPGSTVEKLNPGL